MHTFFDSRTNYFKRKLYYGFVIRFCISLLPNTLFCLHTLTKHFLRQISFRNTVQSMKLLLHLLHQRTLQDHFTAKISSYNFARNFYSPLNFILLCPRFMSVLKVENSITVYCIEIRILREKVFYSVIMTTGIVWLKQMHFLPHSDKHGSHHTALITCKPIRHLIGFQKVP